MELRLEAPLSAPPPAAPVKRKPVVPSSVLGMLIFAATETMFFAGALSAFTISRANAIGGIWPPPGQPRLSPESTAFNTTLLMLSGIALFIAHRQYVKSSTLARWTLLVALVLGAAFVGLQGVEWQALLRQGLTVNSSAHGGFFYLIVGGHALHAVAAIVIMGYAWLQLMRGQLSRGLFFGAQTFWYFVVALWPIIYARVYF